MSDVVVADKGPLAWGGHRFEVSLKPELKFCSDNVFGR